MTMSPSATLKRLQQTLNHLSKDTKPLSILHGSTSSALSDVTLSQLLKEQVAKFPDRDCVVFPRAKHRATYRQLLEDSESVAKGLLAFGIQRGDNVGILAGNRREYIELLFACSHVGAALVVLNNSYTAFELLTALRTADCRLFFTATKIGDRPNFKALEKLKETVGSASLPKLEGVILLGSEAFGPKNIFTGYRDMFVSGSSLDRELEERMATITADDVCNLQFTSGTTGAPKAALLTHNNIINNGRFIGERMRLTSTDKLCCPPPLFHCFGLVLGLLAALTHGASIVFPSETFDPGATLSAVVEEHCTGLHGVPAMFASELDQLKGRALGSSLRTGIAAGAPVPRELMRQLRETMGLVDITNTYGMTETSPATFMTFTDDPLEKRLSTVGRILPHTSAKIIDAEGNTVPLGSRGELCVSGYSLQKGYFRNEQKTKEVMRHDEQGVLWMHTGDEAMFDEEGYCRITGRIKDIIIRGGENIYPLEVEERLVQHSAISQASVVGLPDSKYGEIVVAILQRKEDAAAPDDASLRSFVNETLSHQKVPAHIFWLSDGENFPQTGSAKIKKHVLREKYAKLCKGGTVAKR